jgi:hypothetical protein
MAVPYEGVDISRAVSAKRRVMATSKLEEEYEETLLSDVEECKRQLKYNPTELVHLVLEYGGVWTTLRLIVPEPQGRVRFQVCGTRFQRDKREGWQPFWC